MSGLILPNKWTSQPQVPVEIDWSNPLTRGLRAAVNGISAYDFVTSKFLTVSGAFTKTATPHGVAHTTTAAAESTYIELPFEISGAVSVVVRMSRDVSATTTTGPGKVAPVITNRTGNQATFWEFNLGNGFGASGDIDKPRFSTNAVGIGTIYADGVALSGNNPATTALTNGRFYTLAAVAASGATASSSGKMWLFGLLTAASYSLVGRMPLALVYDRALSAAEIKSLSDNLWQIFKAPALRIWVVGAGSGSTGTVAVTNANDTSAASGTTTIVGTSARTNANDTSSASGTTTITGSLATTNATDTSSANGTTTVTGTLAKTNANDTSAASGSVGNNVSGTVAYTNANDTLSAIGTTTVVGTVAKTNANDTSSASGTTTVIGTLARTNVNDTSAASGVAGSITGTVATTNNNDTVLASGTAGSLRTNRGGGWETYVAPIRKKTVKEVKKEFENLTYSEIVDEQKTAEIKIQHTQAKIQEIKSNVSAVKPFSLAPEIAKLKLLIAEEKIKIEALRELETKILIHAKIKKEKEKLLTDLAFIAEYLMDEDEYDYD